MAVRVQIPIGAQMSLIKTVFEVGSLKTDMRGWLTLKP